jgi:quinolinate synthase
VRLLRDRYPGVPVVAYVNTSAEVKAESDWICTSSNAERVVRAIPEDKQILFAPDKNLGRWLMKKTGRAMRLWQGSCIVHETFSERKLVGLLERHPDAELIAHPECEEAVLERADFIGSTLALLKFVQSHPELHKFIVATEVGILHQMQKRAPAKTLLAAPPEANCACNECPFMRLNTPEKVYLALRDLTPRLEMSEELRLRAKAPLDRMLSLG